MRLLEPVVQVVGRLSFRSKLRITALIFGLPLLVAAGVLVFALNARVTALETERSALAMQVPVHRVSARLYQLLAMQRAIQDRLGGSFALQEQIAVRQAGAHAALGELQRAFAAQGFAGPSSAAGFGRVSWAAMARSIDAFDADGLSAAIAGLRAGLEQLNDGAGLLIDGDAASSRLLGVLTAYYGSLVHATGVSAEIGAMTLSRKSLRGSRRSELTMQRGNFNVLVQWSMEALEKVGQEHPAQAEILAKAAGRLNTAYLAVQEALTTKMLDTTDFGMEPAAFLALTETAFDETLGIGSEIVTATDHLLAERLAARKLQRNGVILAMLAIFALVVAGFVAAYISIMRAVNGLSDAVNTMAAGDLGARVEVTTRDELGNVGEQFNAMAKSLAERSAQLREKTNDIHTMLQNMPQGILTVVDGGLIHPEYSAYLETIFGTDEVAGQAAMSFLFGDDGIGSDVLSQIEATLAACIGEERMNFEFNAHLLVGEITRTLPNGGVKTLELGWSPICDEQDVVEKVMVCVRDVTELRQLEAEAEQQKRELEMIGQILGVQQEKFTAFVDSARNFVGENEALLLAADDSHPELVTQLFRNMHTIKGNARTYGLLHLANIVHEAEQAYDELRRNATVILDKEKLLEQLQAVMASIEQYASLNDVKLGRRGPGRRGSEDKCLMVPRAQIERLGAGLEGLDLPSLPQETLVAVLQGIHHDLRLIGTEPMREVLAAVFASLPSLAAELGKEAPVLVLNDHGIHIRNQACDLLRNVFMHLYRNSLDHGIEPMAERLATGKSAAGRIVLDMALAGGRLSMRLRDDGKGLALAHIRRKGLEKGLIPEGASTSDEDIARLVFAPGFSTASAVTEVSGRGVGMDAVRDFVKREGGEIELRLTDGKVGAGFRAFETLITLSGTFAVQVSAARLPVQARLSPGSESMPAPCGIMGTLLNLEGKLSAT
ncbi:HAMP domain-containing protein [Thauera aromatica]|uniref:Chemotaxis protein CheA n=1 Tax=Thauera aromatica K172 TaxID=44139 RepID=A0A2R4BQ28_THAAR|nr:HAMP domain-containing protein [Thauera aromatica]AVR89429.1 chemotaxis protein CheA [Thauera aromatica K172]